MNEEKKRRWKWWLPVLIAGLTAILVYFFWPEERGREFRRAVFKGNLSKVKRWVQKYPELVNATNNTPHVIPALQSSGPPLDGMERLAVDFFEALTQVRVRASRNSVDLFQSMEDGGVPPLQMALFQAQSEVAKLLVEAGADVQTVSYGGMTALHYAASRDHNAETLQLLLAKGAAPDATNRSALTPLYFSILRGNERNVRLLLQAGSDPNAAGRKGDTPLHHAASLSHPRIITLLLKHGADPGRTNAAGQTPLALAKSRHATNAVLVLGGL